MDSSNNKDYHILSSFWLKIIGMISMVLDHIGVFYEYYHESIPNYSISVQLSFRILGRISFIIFAFLTVESVLHSRKPLMYLLKLFILSLVCDLGFLIFTKQYVGNPITTLLIGATTVYLLSRKEIAYKLLSIIPLVLIILISLEFIPIKADYDIYGFCTIIIFYFSIVLGDLLTKILCMQYGLDMDAFEKSSYNRTLKNAISVSLFATYALIIYFINPIWNGKGLFSENMSIQIYALFGLIPIIFYNGKRGYNKTWFKYSCYAFYPLHLIFIYLLFYFLV